MTTKAVDLSVLVRDPNDPTFVMSSQNAQGMTEDDGVTVVIPLGYMNDLRTDTLPDLTINLIPPPVYLAPTVLVSRTDDYEAGTSTLVCGY